jgi:hypothetical protein
MNLNVNVIALILLAVTLALFFRVWVPWGERASGNLVGVETLSVLGRLRMHGPSVGIVLVASIVLLALGKIGPLTFLLVMALLALLLALPVRYTMTSRGIRAAWTPRAPGRSPSGSPAAVMTTNSSSCYVSSCADPTRGALDRRPGSRSTKLPPPPVPVQSASPVLEATDRQARSS